jgi:hypothetical protein
MKIVFMPPSRLLVRWDESKPGFASTCKGIYNITINIKVIHKVTPVFVPRFRVFRGLGSRVYNK